MRCKDRQIEFVIENYKKKTGKEITSDLKISMANYQKLVDNLIAKGILERKNKRKLI